MARWSAAGGVVDHPLFNAAVYATAALIEVLDYRANRRVITGELELEHADQLEQVDVDWFGPAGENAPSTRDMRAEAQQEPLVDPTIDQ